MKVLDYLKEKTLAVFLLAVPLAWMGSLWHWGDVTVFILAALGIIPLAAYIGEATEALAVHTSSRVGALLNATLGNAAELIITIVAIKAGLLELVKASITGSILGNLLFVMGFSALLGGLKHGDQRFDGRAAGRNAILLILSVIALLVPSVLSHSIGPDTSPRVEALSLGVAVIMMVLYALGLIAAAQDPQDIKTDDVAAAAAPHWSIKKAVLILVLATLGVVWMSEMLVHVVEAVTAGLGLSEFFIGVILVPIIGNVAEHLVAVQMALQNRMTLSVEIAVSSSLQIALLVAPLLVFISLLMGNPLQLIFNTFELLALLVGVLIAALVSFDGESSWLEGATLLAVYLILGLAFFLLP